MANHGEVHSHKYSNKRDADDVEKTIRDNYEDTKETLKTRGQEAKRLFTDTTAEVGHQAKEMFNKASEEVKERSVHLRDAVTQYVDEKPMTALGIAALVGLAIGVLLRK